VAIARDDMMFRLDDLARSFGYFASDGRDHGINVRHRWGVCAVKTLLLCAISSVRVVRWCRAAG
jgi:hypothetical protein